MIKKLWEVELHWDSWSIKYYPRGDFSAQEVFLIVNTSELSNLEIELLGEFWSARSPYVQGEKVGNLQVTSSVIEVDKELPWYLLTILIHELTDHDDSPTSMLDAEKLVIQDIFTSDISNTHKNKLVSAHLWFFSWVKKYYEKSFEKYEKYYKNNAERFNNDHEHYSKIVTVVEYLDAIIWRMWKLAEIIPIWGFRARVDA